MRKLHFFLAIFLVAITSNALAGGQGSIKIPFDPEVGWVIINTTASGKIMATAHLHEGLPNEEFSVSVRVRYEDGSTDVHQDIAVLSTNEKGKGNVQVQVEINPPPGSQTIRRFAFRARRAPQPLYLAVAWDIPLK
jgi:hypothetical protein